MDAAEALILDQGFAGTSVQQVIERAGITKGTFFYHFDTKQELAHALVDRYAAMDRRHLEEGMARAEREHEDPLEQMLAFLHEFEEEAEALTEPYPGCLFASYCYQHGLLDRRTMELVEGAVLLWRRRLTGKLREVAERHPPRHDVDLEALADMLWVIFEGAFILSRTLNEPQAVARQLALYRVALRQLFGGGPR